MQIAFQYNFYNTNQKFTNQVVIDTFLRRTAVLHQMQEMPVDDV